jgi:hemolysin-activating ACP:hemolysin acyltransferase
MTTDPAPLNGSRESAIAGDGGPKTVPPVAALKFAATLGQIVLVLMRTRQHRLSYLSDLEWLVMPAIATNQFMVAEHRDSNTGLSVPSAVAVWAMVSKEVDARLSGEPVRPIRLRPEEWVSGTIPWLVEAAGDSRAVGDLLRTLIDKRFPVDGIKTIGRSPDGTPGVRVLRKEVMTSGEQQPGRAEAAPPS